MHQGGGLFLNYTFPKNKDDETDIDKYLYKIILQQLFNILFCLNDKQTFEIPLTSLLYSQGYHFTYFFCSYLLGFLEKV